MAHKVQVLAAKPDSLSQVPMTHMGKGVLSLVSCLLTFHAGYGMFTHGCVCTFLCTLNSFIFKKTKEHCPLRLQSPGFSVIILVNTFVSIHVLDCEGC